MKNLLWDLDGTLTDPKVGILRSIQFALKEFGNEVPEEKDLIWCIGPPLHETFQKLIPHSSESEAWKYVSKYRERFSTIGLYENELIEGIPGLLNDLKKHRHFVATSKPHVFATKILDHFGIERHFRRVYGSELDGTRANKAQLIAHILEQESLNARDSFMIGDRLHDILGAKENGVSAIGITWGYGSSEELQRAGADHIFNSPTELRLFLND